MSKRQFVIVKFRITDTRTYTYANDGEPVNDGDVVRVADARADGWKKVYVVSVTDEAPAFECKPILGLHVEEEPTPLEAAAETPAREINPSDPFGLPSLD